MPRPGQPPPSALRNRNRITNKTRLKVIHGNVDVDQIIPDEDEEKNRLLQIVAGVDLEDAKEHHLQAVLSEAAGVTGRKSQERPAAFIPIPEHTGLADNFSTLYPSDRWNDPVSYVQSSAVVEEYITAALADGCTYYMDERDKEWLDRNNEEARGEGTSAQGAVSPSTGRTTTRSAKAKGKEPEDVQALFMTEDEYELVMGLFEKITQEKTEFLHHSLESDTMHFPEFSEYQDILSSPLPPSTFAAYSPPSWLPEPSKLVRLARIVYPYWKERCLERAGRRIIPTLNFDESDTLNESYVCFRRRETKAIRKTRASQVTSSDKLARLQTEFEFPLQLAKQLVEREQLKRDSSRQSRIVWDLRTKVVELKIKNPSIGDKGDEELLVDKERLSKKSESSRVRLPVKQETPSQSSSPPHNIIRPNERYALYQTNVDKLLQIRKEQDQHWDDHVDTGYVSMMAPYASRLFKYVGPPQSSSPKSSFEDGESAAESVPKRPVRLRYGRGGRAFVDRRPPPLRIAKRRRLARFSDDEQTLMDIDSSPLKDDEAELRLAERWRFDSDDGPLYGPAGSDEHDRMLVDDYDPKYTHSLFDVADYAFLYTDPTIVRTLPDGKKENYIPYRLGITPPMNIAVPQRPASVQSQGAVPVSQQVHSVPISQQLKIPTVGNRSSPSSAVSNQGAVNTSAPAVVAPASQGSPPPRLQTAMPLPQITHNGRAAMTMPSVDMMKLATSHNASAFQSEIEAARADSTNGSDPSQLPRPNTQLQQVHAQQSTQMQSQAAAQAQPSTVSSLHPAYAALVNANPTTYIPQYLYPTTSATGLNNQQMQHLKSVFNAANLGGVQNYNSAVFAHMQMPKAANGVVNGIPAAQNMHNFNSVNMTPVARQMQRVPSAVVNGASPSPPRPSSVVNGTMHDSNGSSSPLMNHAAVPGEPRVSTRSPSGMAIRGSGSPIMGAQLHAQQQQQQMLNGQMQQQLLQMHNQSSPPPTMYTAQSYSLSPSPSKMQPASLSGSPVLHQHQHQQQQQQQQAVGSTQGIH
ncbi:hypothetical protein D9757_007529 [Collybiopsis confluens]|uniref:Enhancer of polycomb-like protein n=1 Tax=Collybiopsis confluens TaxID=2823264 RepID=A0A8H5HJN8_9AGAR|nr:hypothetical protein D9757_007529 [Collybiopsis confluens]